MSARTEIQVAQNLVDGRVKLTGPRSQHKLLDRLNKKTNDLESLTSSRRLGVADVATPTYKPTAQRPRSGIIGMVATTGLTGTNETNGVAVGYIWQIEHYWQAGSDQCTIPKPVVAYRKNLTDFGLGDRKNTGNLGLHAPEWELEKSSSLHLFGFRPARVSNRWRGNPLKVGLLFDSFGPQTTSKTNYYCGMFRDGISSGQTNFFGLGGDSK